MDKYSWQTLPQRFSEATAKPSAAADRFEQSLTRAQRDVALFHGETPGKRDFFVMGVLESFANGVVPLMTMGHYDTLVTLCAVQWDSSFDKGQYIEDWQVAFSYTRRDWVMATTECVVRSRFDHAGVQDVLSGKYFPYWAGVSAMLDAVYVKYAEANFPA